MESVYSPIPQKKPRAAMAALGLGFFITVLDATIINIAIPTIADELNSSLSKVLWTVNIYTLVITAFLISMGRLGDYFGPKRLFIIGMIIFAIASFFCGISSSTELLVLSRLLQAIGAAMIIPQPMVIIIQTFPQVHRPWAFGLWGATGGIAAVVGPTLGGGVITLFGWPSIFFINIPLGILIIILAYRFLPECKCNPKEGFDLIGLILLTLSLGTISFSLMEWDSYELIFSVFMFLLGIAMLLFFCMQQKFNQSKYPIIPFGIFYANNYSKMLIVIGLNAIAILTLIITLSIYLQTTLKINPIYTGFVIAPASLCSIIISTLIGRLSTKFSLFALLKSGLFVTALGIMILIFNVFNKTSIEIFIMSMVIIGIGNGLTVAPMNLLAMENVSSDLVGAASGFLNTVRQLGMALAGIVLGCILQGSQSRSPMFYRIFNDRDYVIMFSFLLPFLFIVFGFAIVMSIRVFSCRNKP